ncbi:PREDICTED: serine/threonine-protein kinase 16-like [Amphimedon queenslandica]|uniref:non-specific serine/threonine protein kinase n=1 Tax=Amphimedon queenslandica TaxID=400682 RepID=A0A1X7U188_AMPQE|nr:PREDICTED: serine/threonine-protein kinase 16-like [Amphimedon queenslandica]|eukprot:XP_003389271.2 PREDICTED: serine/threonine-protein kinase 16-like [Amphimedon queenslandica]
MGALWSLLFGRTLSINGESYRVVRRIGEGGFSYVDLVRGRNGEQFALKQLLIQVEEQRESVEREIYMHQTVTHPNVLQLVDSQITEQGNGEARGLLLFPFYQYGTLEDEIEASMSRGRKISEERILNLFLSACQGLHALHTSGNEGLAHRDIKPGNLLLSDNKEELVIMDLGSAASGQVTVNDRKEAIALQEHCAQTCTAMYRAPELFEVPSQSVITLKSDIWSLGCSIYAAAFGTSPCDGSALSAMSGRIMFPKNHSYSLEFCNLITWILKVNPEERPTVQEVEQLIGTILSKQVTPHGNV